MSDAKPHLSATQLDMFCRCPEAYRRRYVEGEIIPPGVAILKGSGFHAGAEHNMRQKIESHADLPAADIVEAAVAGFEAGVQGGYLLTVEEESIGGGKVLGQAKDDLAEMAAVHAVTQAPDYQPVYVEQVVRLALPGPRDLLAVIDLADDSRRIVDFKTSGKAKSQADADDSVQLTVYATAYRALTGQEPAALRLDTVVQTATKTTRQVVETTRGPADVEALAHRINAVSAGIDAGIFTPATPGAWWCGAKWCGYHSTCRFVRH